MLLAALGGAAFAQDEGWEPWIERLSDPDWEVREEATRRLVRTPAARAALEALAAAEDPELEYRARFVLENLGNVLADPEVRIAINGSASLAGEGARALVLTPAAGGTGSAFLAEARPAGSFSSCFRFRIGDPSGMWDGDGVQGADGMAYVLAADPEALGEGGGGIGWLGLSPALVVEFDTYRNATDPDGNHAAIHVGGRPEALAAAHVDGALNGGGEWWAWVDHDAAAGRLELRLSRGDERPADPLLSAEVDLAAIFGERAIHHGFTAATGGATNSHVVELWRIETGQR